MKFPSFILGDNSDYPESIFVVHTGFPRFIIDIKDDQFIWIEKLSKDDKKELKFEVEGLISQAYDFYDREISKLNKKTND